MSEKVRVFKLADEFGLDNETMVAKVQNFGFEVKNYMSFLEEEDAQRVRRLLEKEKEEDTVEEQIRPTVVRRRSKSGAQPKPERTKPPKPVAAESSDSPVVRAKEPTKKSPISTKTTPAVVHRAGVQPREVKSTEPKTVGSHKGMAPHKAPVATETSVLPVVDESTLKIQHFEIEPVEGPEDEEAEGFVAEYRYEEEEISEEDLAPKPRYVAQNDEEDFEKEKDEEDEDEDEEKKNKKGNLKVEINPPLSTAEKASSPAPAAQSGIRFMERPIEVRPSHEAPIIRRRIDTNAQDASGKRSKTSRPQKRKRMEEVGQPSISSQEGHSSIEPSILSPVPTPRYQQYEQKIDTSAGGYENNLFGNTHASGSGRKRQVESRDFDLPGRGRQAVSQNKFAVGPGRKRRAAPGKKGKKTEITVPKAIKRVIRIEGEVSLQELAKRMSIKATELLMKLIGLGMAGININSTLDVDTAKIVAEEFAYEVENVEVAEDDLLAEGREEESEEEAQYLELRSPVVTMMGHVDHGKTSLLDYIRKANVVDSEAGGITQHIGAYRVKTPSGMVAFIDTPGHAAFSAMRARGADATDIVVLVVAADDGVMPQTIEAIQHAKAAQCPILVAINKSDLPGADPQKVRRMLMSHELLCEELGGNTIMVEVSAKTGLGIDKLLEMLALQAEIMELRANPRHQGTGVVLEAYLDRGRGPVANILVQNGTLKTGDVIVVGGAFGKVRMMTDELGRKVVEAGPSTPVEVLGLNNVPSAGDSFDVVKDMRVAEKVAESRTEKTRRSIIPSARPALESLYQQMQGDGTAELKLIVKSDVNGTGEAIKKALLDLSGTKVKVTVLHTLVGAITESDVLLASAAGAIIIGFNVRPAGKAKRLAEEQGIDIKVFSIIYEVVDAVKAAMLGLLTPETREEALGTAQVRDIFSIPKIGTIAGSYVTEGKISRQSFVRLIRDSVQIWEGKPSSLRRFKDDVKEVQNGFECGISLEGYNDIKIGDVIEFYLKKEVEATLS